MTRRPHGASSRRLGQGRHGVPEEVARGPGVGFHPFRGPACENRARTGGGTSYAVATLCGVGLDEKERAGGTRWVTHCLQVPVTVLYITVSCITL